MRIGITLPTMMPGLDRETLLAWARRIDARPFATLAAGERIAFPNPDLMVAMGAAAAVTTRVELMLTVVVLPLHAAAVVAKQIATLDVLANGRVTVGVGVGGREEDFRAVGVPFEKRLGRMEAQVATMRRLWSDEPSVPDTAPVGPRPVHEPPVLVGALSHDSIRRAARWADGLCGFSFGPDGAEVAAAFDVARTAWRERGRPSPPPGRVGLVLDRARRSRPHGRVRRTLPRRLRRPRGAKHGPSLHDDVPLGAPGRRPSNGRCRRRRLPPGADDDRPGRGGTGGRPGARVTRVRLARAPSGR